MSAFIFYTLFYLLMSGCIVYPPTEFVSAGLTVKDIFANWLGSENEFFIQYHIRRSVITLLVHSMLPLGNKDVLYFYLLLSLFLSFEVFTDSCIIFFFCSGYILGLIFFGHVDAAKLFHVGGNFFGLLVVLCFTIGPFYMLNKVFEWSAHDWATHPIALNLSVYSNNNMSWMSVASDINVEYRRFIQKKFLTLINDF